jgi:hypothetical protein
VGATRRALSLVLRALLAPLVVGGLGTWLAVRGHGSIVVYGPVQDQGLHRLLAVAAVWLVAVLVVDRPWAQDLLRVGAVAAAVAVTRANIGGQQGLVGMAGVVVVHAATWRWQPTRTWPTRPRAVAWPALVPVLVAHLVWVRGGGLAPTLALLAVGLAVVELHHRRPELVEPLHRPVDRLASAVATRTTAAARRAWSTLRSTAPLIGPAVARGATEAATRVRAWRAPASWARRVAATLARAGRRVVSDREATAAVVASMVAMGVVSYRFVTRPPDEVGSYDYQTHLSLAVHTRWWPFHVDAPHPLFHLGVALLRSVLGVDWAATVTLAAAAGLTAAAVVWVCRRPFDGRPGLPVGWAGAFAFGSIFLDTPAMVARALHLGSPWAWAPTTRMVLSPTDTVQMGFAVILLVLVARALDPARPLGPDDGPVLAVVAVAAALAKPSLTLVLVPGSMLRLAVGRDLGRERVELLARWFWAPSAVIVAWQTWLLGHGGVTLRTSGVAVSPMATIRDIHLLQAGPLIATHLLVVPLCLWAGGARYRRTPELAVLGWSALPAAAQLILLVDTGTRASDGNLAKPAFIVSALVYLFSWRFLLGEVAARRGGEPGPTGRRAWAVAVAAFAAVSLAAGTLGYLEAAGVIHLAPRGG